MVGVMPSPVAACARLRRSAGTRTVTFLTALTGGKMPADMPYVKMAWGESRRVA